MHAIARDRSIRLVLAGVVAVWLVALAAVYFAPGAGRALTGFNSGVPLSLGHPDLAAVHQVLAALLVGLAGYGVGAPLATRLAPEEPPPRTSGPAGAPHPPPRASVPAGAPHPPPLASGPPGAPHPPPLASGWAGAALGVVDGVGLVGHGLLVFAAVGIYRPAPVIALIAVCAALALPTLARSARAVRLRPPRLSPLGWAVAALLAVVLAFCLAGALAPEVGIDPLWYHLGFPHRWLMTGHLDDFPLQYTAVYPFSTELLYGSALALDGDVAAKVVHLLFGVLLVLGVVDLGRRLFSPRAALAGGLVLAAAPMVMWEATTAHIDLASATFVVWAVDVAVATRARPSRRAAVAVGVLFAFGLGSKLVMAFAAPALVLLVLFGAPERALRERIIDTVVMLALAPLAALPFLVRAEVLTGNPFFPSFYDLFGAKDGRWTAESERGLDGLLQGFGDGHGALHFVTLPWDLTMKTGHFDGTFGLLFLVLVPLALTLRPRRMPFLLALGVLLYFFCWFFVGRTLQARFLVPAFALAAPFAGAGFDRAWTLLRGVGRPAAAAFTAAVGLLLVLALPPFLGWWDRERDHGRPIAVAIDHTPVPFLLGAQSRTAYIDRYVAIHESDRILAKLAHPGDRVLSIDAYIDNLHTPVEHAPYFAALLGQIYNPDLPDTEQLALLRRHHLRFILVNKSEPDARLNGPIALLSDRFRRRHLRLVHEDPRSALYEVRGL